jgi:hypothetical protein
MNYKEFLQNFTIIFIVWEVIKVFIIPHILWKNTKIAWSQTTIQERKGGNIRINLQKKNPILTMIGYVYLLYSILLIFSKWWWVSITMIALSSGGIMALKPYIKRNAPFNFKIWAVFLLDFIFSVFLLSQVNPIIINFIKS